MRTLDTTIDKVLSTGPRSTLKERLKNELRDYFAHEVMKFEHKTCLGVGNGTIYEFFDTIFKHIPAFKKETNK